MASLCVDDSDACAAGTEDTPHIRKGRWPTSDDLRLQQRRGRQLHTRTAADQQKRDAPGHQSIGSSTLHCAPRFIDRTVSWWAGNNGTNAVANFPSPLTAGKVLTNGRSITLGLLWIDGSRGTSRQISTTQRAIESSAFDPIACSHSRRLLLRCLRARVALSDLWSVPLALDRGSAAAAFLRLHVDPASLTDLVLC